MAEGDGPRACNPEWRFGSNLLAVMDNSAASAQLEKQYNRVTISRGAQPLFLVFDRYPEEALQYSPMLDGSLRREIADKYGWDADATIDIITLALAQWRADRGVRTGDTGMVCAALGAGVLAVARLGGTDELMGPDKGGGSGGSYGSANNLKGKAFENLVESLFSRQGRNVFFRTQRAGGLDLVSLENGMVVLNEAKFQNKSQFADFTAITTNLKSNIKEVLGQIRGNTSLTVNERRLVIQTLETFVEDGITPPNLKLRIISGKGEPIGPRVRMKLAKSTGGIPIEYEDFRQ